MHYETGVGLKHEFIDNVRYFFEHAMTLDIFKNNGLVRCPCSACKCLNFFDPYKVIIHLYRNGFKQRYFVWIDYGEMDGLDGMFYNSMSLNVYNRIGPHVQTRVE